MDDKELQDLQERMRNYPLSEYPALAPLIKGLAYSLSKIADLSKRVQKLEDYAVLSAKKRGS